MAGFMARKPFDFSITPSYAAGMKIRRAQTDNGLTLNTTIVPINTYLHHLDPDQNRCSNALDNIVLSVGNDGNIPRKN